jgi:L-threonylcarbamoyladenylate synthase
VSVELATIAAAARALEQGLLVAFPTETVYGLGADAANPTAVAAIYAAKGRPQDHPVIVHLAPDAPLDDWATAIPDQARQLAAAFWPGPLTMILKRAPEVPADVSGGQDTIGLRCPAHPVARAVLAAARELGVHGVAAPSANRFGRVSPTQARHVVDEFEPGLLVLDGGDCEVGIESSIVDCSRGGAVLLRPGVLTQAQIEAALGQTLQGPDAQAPRASGTLAAHYAPRATVRLYSAADLAARLSRPLPAGLAVYSRTVVGGQGAWLRRMPADALAAAQQLFAVLRDLDAAGAQEIWIELPPPSKEWDGVRDRLTRAAAAFEA